LPRERRLCQPSATSRFSGITALLKQSANISRPFSPRLRPCLSLKPSSTKQFGFAKQARKIKLGDSLVAGTALLHDLTLVTRNVDDFTGIDGLKVLNPFAELRP